METRWTLHTSPTNKRRIKFIQTQAKEFWPFILKKHSHLNVGDLWPIHTGAWITKRAVFWKPDGWNLKNRNFRDKKVSKSCKKLESCRITVVNFLTKIMKSIRWLKNYKVKMKRNLEPNLSDQNKYLRDENKRKINKK
jgi:hypothetical protein